VSGDTGGEGGDDSDGGDGRLGVLADCLALKDERRTGWQRRGVDDPESVAAHSWGVGLLCLVFADDAGVDPGEALRLAVVHDLAEARIGDLPTRADPADEPVPAAEKTQRERAAMTAFGERLPAVERLWERYERQDTTVATFVKDMDLLDMCLQALVYERERRYDRDPDTGPDADADHGDAHLDEFFASAEPRLSTDVGRELFAAVRARYEGVRDGAADTGDRSGDDRGESTEL
jgi:putative hydrolase of HD superfamily